MKKNVLILLVIGLLVLASHVIVYGELTIPYTFSPNTTAKSSEVNANFAAVKAAVDEISSQTRLDTNADKLIFSTCDLSSVSIAQNEVKAFECPVPGAQFVDKVIVSGGVGLNVHTIGALVTTPGMVRVQVQNLQTDLSGAHVQFQIMVFHVAQ